MTYTTTNDNSQKQPNIVRHGYQHQKVTSKELDQIQTSFLEVISHLKPDKKTKRQENSLSVLSSSLYKQGLEPTRALVGVLL